MTEPLSVERRREIFAALVAAQDGGQSVAESREHIATVHEIDAKTVRSIEEEGERNEWPPLGE